MTTSLRGSNPNASATWRAYWQARDQLWRTQPEIDIERQKYLERCLTVNTEQRRPPFKDIVLSRADVEWLLVPQKDWIGTVDSSYGLFRRHIRIDLRGAILNKVDLSHLPLERTNFEGANLYGVRLEGANLLEAHLENANLSDAHLEETNLGEIHLERAKLPGAHLERAYIVGGHLEGVNLKGAFLQESILRGAYLEKANLCEAHLERVDLGEGHLEGTILERAHLEGANFREAHLEEAIFYNAHLEGANLHKAHLEGSDLAGAFFTSATNLRNIILGNEKLGFVLLAGVRWGDVDLTVVDWTPIKVLGDERQARQLKMSDGTMKDAATRLDEYRTAVRANRQLAVVLQAQGLNEEAAHFAYRAQVLQRLVSWKRRKFDQYLFSQFLNLLSGYGYKLWRSLAAYVLVILGFAVGYFLLKSVLNASFSPLDAIVFSVISFHGRGFSPSESIGLSSPFLILSAIEAFVGLIIEVTLIATLTQRFFKR